MCLSFSLSVAFHWVLQFIYWNAIWLTKSVGHTVQDIYARLGWLVTRYYSELEDWQCANIGLPVGGMANETISYF